MGVCTLFLLTKTCLCVTFNISHRVTTQLNLTNPSLYVTLKYETMPENIYLTDATDCRRVCSNNACLYATFSLTKRVLVQIFT